MNAQTAGTAKAKCVLLSPLAMGDTSACESAQASHIAVLYRRQVLHPSELLAPFHPVPLRLADP